MEQNESVAVAQEIDEGHSVIADKQDVATPLDYPTIPQPKKRRKWLKRLIVLVILAAVVLAGVFVMLRWRDNNPETAQAQPEYVEHTVGTQSITLTLGGTGTLNPADAYKVTSMVSGSVLTADFEEGDVVAADTVLYEVDNSTALTGLEQAELSLQQQQRSHDQKLKALDDLKIRANESGRVVELMVGVGDKVSAGAAVARIRDSDYMTLTLPFVAADAQSMTVGASANVVLDGSFERFDGTITDISVVDDWLDGGVAVRQVTVQVSNNGGIYPGQVATATVGGTPCAASGTFSYRAESVVTAAATGEVAAIGVREGERVRDDAVMVTLSSQSLENEIFNSGNNLRNSELNLEDRYTALDDYTITSPIAGTIIEKNIKAGDNVSPGHTLCTIYDLSYLTMTLNVDELDIAKVAVGQQVMVTVEALEGRFYVGQVTKIGINGSASSGATTYPVTIRIDQTDGLLPGMNAQATITVSQSVDTPAIPVMALQRGNFVLIKLDEGAAQSEIAQRMGAPEGYDYKVVVSGISDGVFIEIVDGLAVGDIIYYMPTVAGASGEFDFQSMPFRGMSGTRSMEGASFSTSGAMPAGEVRVITMP